MRLNLGCGNKHMDGWVNVDKFATPAVDQVLDLEKFPWPWADDSVDEVLLFHVLEHLGAQTDTYLGIFKELYRVCRDGATILIAVPHPRHDSFISDPTHVRPITPEGINLFSQAANREWIAAKAANTPLGIYIGVDFLIESVNWKVEPAWKDRFDRKEITERELEHAVRTYNNVVKAIEMILRPIKPAGRTSSSGAAAA
jgi:SAM-dependent methyltransferase